MKIKLRQAFDLQMGKTPARNRPDYWSGDRKWISIADIGNTGKYITETKESITEAGIEGSGIKVVPQGTVIMSFKLSIGKTAITSEGMYTNEAIMAFIDNGKFAVDTDYLYHLCCGTNWTAGTNKAVMGLTLNKATLLEKEIPLPDINEQHEIANNLDKIDAIIAERQQQLALIDQAVKSRFIELFGMPGTDAFGWGLVPLGSTCNINPKKSFDSRLVSGAEVSFVPMPAVTEHGDIDATAIKEYDEVKKGFTYFAENDVLFAKITPCMENGKGAVAKGLHNGIGFGSTEFHVLRPISGKTNPYWIYTLTAFSQFRTDAANNMTGSAGQRRVPASFLENYRVSLPPIALQEQFAAFVEQTDKSKYYSSLSFRYCQAAANTYRQEWMTCRTSDF